jgi:hypothetical protein
MRFKKGYIIIIIIKTFSKNSKVFVNLELLSIIYKLFIKQYKGIHVCFINAPNLF